MKAARLIVPLALLALVATPALAGGHERVGDRIGLFSPAPMSFPQGQPFHIAHGHAIAPEERAAPPAPIGRFEFGLDIDGVPVRSDFVERSVLAEEEGPPTFALIWVFNFPEGMQGTHLFTGHWYAPCEYAVNNGLYAGSCANPAAMVEFSTRSREVIFN